MRKSLVIVESFYDDPGGIREYALGQRYYYPYQADAEVASGRLRPSWLTSWFKKARDCPFKSCQALIEKLNDVTGEEVDMDYWNLDFPVDAEGKAAKHCTAVTRSCLWNCCFHLKPETRQDLGEGVHNHVTDSWNSVGDHGWAGIIYLSPDAPLCGGLKLWRNHDPTKNFDWMTPRENWELIDDLGNVYNRLLLCRGNIPHSGAAGWGSNLRNGRLYQTFFFKTRRFINSEGLKISYR